MFTANDFETFWLTATNIVLGLVTLVCILVMASGLVRDIKARVFARRAVSAHADDHAFVVPMLGVTMADGGERVDAPHKAGDTQKTGENIVRSTN